MSILKFNLPVKAIIAALFILSASPAHAQMTDKQLQNALEQYHKNNIPQATILKEFTSRGVTPAQMERVTASMEGQMKDKPKSTDSKSSSTNRLSEAKQDVDAGITTAPGMDAIERSVKSEDDVFGRDLFSSKNLTFQPSLNLPTPVNYQLGAGDELLIDIWGESEMSIRQKISPEGHVNIQGLGPIRIAGMDIQEATAKLKREFGKILSGINDGTAFLKLSLGESRSIQVNIMGEVEAPGTYTLSSFSTVFHALYAAGGTNEIGSLRSIAVFRGGKIVSVIDLYTYLMDGSSGGDIILREGDIVKVEPYRTMVKISGEIRRPMRYEMKEGESLTKLIQYAGDFKGDAYKKNVYLTRMGSTQRRVYNVDSEDFATFGLHDADNIVVGPITNLYDNRVEVFGAVHREGSYAIGPGIETVSELVRAAEGVRGDALLKRVFLYRENHDLTFYLEAIDLQALLAGEIPDITLKKNDRLSIPSEFEIFESRMLTIHGEVKSTGEYPFADNTTVKDLILRAGGLLESASQTRIDVSRRIKDPMSTKESIKIGIVKTLSLQNGLFSKEDEDFILEPYDEVVVRRSPGYQSQQNITVQGEVLFQGVYALQSTDERLSSIVKRSGGVTSLAFLKGARLIREHDHFEKARQEAAMRVAEKRDGKDSISFASLNVGDTYAVGIDLAKAIANPGGQEDIILRKGDVITIPGEIGVVKISGAVLFPNAVTYYKNKNLGDYISNAGGYSKNAMSSRVYVLYMNGNTSRGRRSKIEPGCEIIVPQKDVSKRMSLGEVVSLSASVTSVAAIVISIMRNK